MAKFPEIAEQECVKETYASTLYSKAKIPLVQHRAAISAIAE